MKRFLYLKKEILGIEDVRETVKAIEKISSANLHFLKITSQRMREYEDYLKRILRDTSQELNSPLFKENENSKKRLIVCLTFEKGLCRGLLNQLFDYLENLLKGEEEIILLGEAGKKRAEERNIKIDYFFSLAEEIPQKPDIEEVENLIISQFLAEKYKEVFVLYPSFQSFAQQKPEIFKFLPFEKERFKIEKESVFFADPIYEPSRKTVLDFLIKEYLGLSFYQKVLETKLSEFSARTFAMQEAEEKAKKIIRQLFHQYFREKKKSITKDITDLYGRRYFK